jgi:hypothetical protein
VALLDVAGGIPPTHRRHDPENGFERLVKVTVLIGVENQIAAEVSAGESDGLADSPVTVGPHERDAKGHK